MRLCALLPWLVLSTAPLACTAGPEASGPRVDGAEITEVNHTPVKDQPIGNCWIYASLGWVESLEQRATGATPDYSEAYFTMQDWLLKLVNGFGVENGIIETGGGWELTQEELPRIGLMKESDFVFGKTVADAERAFNLSLASGKLATADARQDADLVQSELFEAFGVSENTRARILADEGIVYPDDVPVQWPNKDTLEPESHSLGDALVLWQAIEYPAEPAARRALQTRVQRAMHGGAPVVISWLVDFNALTGSTFSLTPLRAKGPGRQGGHMSLMYDYQATNVPGFGTLKAGELETRPEALAAALLPETTLEFFRIKNSWGDTVRPDDAKPTDPPSGYYDLEQTYLDGPIEAADGTGSQTPLFSVVLPLLF